MFWWYWSARQRLLLLAAVLLPVVGFFAFRTLLGDGGSAADRPAVTAPVDEAYEAAAPQSEMLILASDDSRSAASVFPVAFGDFGEGSVQTKNMVFPGQAFDEYSVYLFFRSVSPGDVALPSVTTVVGATVPSTLPVSEDVAEESTEEPVLLGTTVETIRDGLRWHFTELGGIARNVEARSGVELFVAGLESGRGYQGTLRFQAVPGGVVVRGLVVEVPANEIADLIEESQEPSGSDPAGAAEPTEGDAPATGEGPAVPPTTDTTVPSAPTTRP